MNVSRAEGLVDMHVSVSVSRETSTESTVMVVANVLRQRRLGKCQTTVVE